MNNEKEKLTVRTKDLLALCHILEQYEEFSNNIKNFITPNDRDLLYEIQKKANKKFYLSTKSRKINNFFQENQNTIENINQYSDIFTFINLNYLQNQETIQCNLDSFYQYIIENKNNLQQIISLIEKINNLGFSTIHFNPNQNFTNQEYSLNTASLNYNTSIEILDNITLIPQYQRDYIKYKTNGSNYQISIKLFWGQLDQYGNDITVNSLLFDPQKLPDCISKETTFDQIINLTKKQRETYQLINSATDLSVSIDDLEKKAKTTQNIIAKLNKNTNKEELISILNTIILYINELKSQSISYNNNIIQNENDITSEILAEEKKLYLQRRKWNQYDLD